MAHSNTNWLNRTGIALTAENLENYLGFIYRITTEEGKVYYGRKQFWSRRGKDWYESDWKTYTSSSNYINKYIENNGIESCTFEILAIFTSKSALRYAEAKAIVESGSYEDPEFGLNGSFAGCRGKIKCELTDAEQFINLERLIK